MPAAQGTARDGRSLRASHRKMAVLVAHRLVAEIDREQLEPGHRLPPERLMLEQYGVGRGTLREALRFLELQGVLTLKPGPGGGPIVSRPEPANLASMLVLVLQFEGAPFRTIVESRVTLEPVLAGLAAERIGPEELAELAATIEQMARNREDADVYFAANQRFHEVIASASGNALFATVLKALLGILDGTVVGIDYPEPRLTAIVRAHGRVFAALEAGDAQAAARAMRDHTLEYLHYAERRFPHVLARRVTWDTLPV